MAKYTNEITVTSTESGKRYYTTALPESYVPSETDFTYTSQLGDRWDLLAHRFYGAARYWYILARANGGINGSIFITPGTQVIIPEIV